MNENRTKSWLYIVIVLAVSAMAVYFQTILNTHYLDAETGMYQYGAKTPGAFYFFIGVVFDFFRKRFCFVNFSLSMLTETNVSLTSCIEVKLTFS